MVLFELFRFRVLDISKSRNLDYSMFRADYLPVFCYQNLSHSFFSASFLMLSILASKVFNLFR